MIVFSLAWNDPFITGPMLAGSKLCMQSSVTKMIFPLACSLLCVHITCTYDTQSPITEGSFVIVLERSSEVE